jgi:hypothetical protein
MAQRSPIIDRDEVSVDAVRRVSRRSEEPEQFRSYLPV